MPLSRRWNSMEAASTPYGLVPTVLELLKSVFRRVARTATV
jgi:hypothetical protein